MVIAIVVLLVVEGWVVDVVVDGWVDVVVGVVVLVVVVVNVVVVDWVVVLSGVDVGWVDVIVVESVVLTVVSTDGVEVDATVDVTPPNPHSSVDLHTLTTGSKTSAPLQLWKTAIKNKDKQWIFFSLFNFLLKWSNFVYLRESEATLTGIVEFDASRHACIGWIRYNPSPFVFKKKE